MTHTGQDLNLQAALELINARRRQDGLPPLAQFAAYAPAPAADPLAQQAETLQQGQDALDRRRAQLGVHPAPRFAPRPERPAQPLPPPSSPIPPKPAAAAPEWLRSWPVLTLAAARHNAGGAIRAWDVARALDPAGSGQVSRKDLLSWLSKFGVTRSTRNHWLRDAVQIGLFRYARKRQRILLTGLQAACALFGLRDPGSRAELRASDLLRQGWKGAVWDGALTPFSGPVSRATLHDVTGVRRRTQLNYQQKGKSEAQANYAYDPRADADQIEGYCEFVKSHAFVVRFKAGKETLKRIAYRIPNRYQVPATAARLAGGKYRSMQIRLSNLQASANSTTPEVVSEISGSELTGTSRQPIAGGTQTTAAAKPVRSLRAGDANPGGPRRIYFERAKALKTAVRRMAKRGQVSVVYEYLPGGLARRRRMHPHGWWRVERS